MLKGVFFKSNNAPGVIYEEFNHYNATDFAVVKAADNDIMFINWKIAVSRGTVTVVVKSKKQVIWKSASITGNDTADLFIPLKRARGITINVNGNQATGKVSLKYETVPPKNINVAVNPNIELFGLMMEMDNAPDFIASKDSVEIKGRKCMWKDWYALAIKNYARFKSFDSCSMMQQYRQCISRSLYNDFFIRLLLETPHVPHADLTDKIDDDVILPFSVKGNLEDAKKEASSFLKAFNQFYQDTHFDGYLKEYEPYLTAIIEQVQKNLPPTEFISVMEHFYHKSFTGYYFTPSFTVLPTMGFGKTHKKTNSIYNTFGPFSFIVFDSQPPDPGFDFPEQIRNLSVHEFGHSFVNPAIDKLPAELLKSTERLYEPIRETMSRHAYTQWTMCLYEHFVKAGEILISRYMGQKDEAEKMLTSFVNDGFIYLPFILKEFKEYTITNYSDRNYDSFVVKVMKHLKDAKEFK